MYGWIIRLGLFKVHVAEPFDCFSRGCWNIRWNIRLEYILYIHDMNVCTRNNRKSYQLLFCETDV